MDLSDYFQSILRLTPDNVNIPVKSALTFLESNNADLTPRIVREGVSGVISAQWSCSCHWMEECLQRHNLTVHGI